MWNVSREDWVRQFMKAGDIEVFSKEDPDDDTCNMIFNCLAEEYNEFLEAAQDYRMDPFDADNRAQLCKEWADVQYTLSQAACFFEIPASVAFVRVAENNLTKVSEDGTIRRREDGKILKPDGYESTDMRGL